ncbi:serine/threonine-protein phosphatase [Actinoallomurus sp. NBC_01490]|uniref:PP2C family protein-serine/threonine phosphatase n=1 Tax=Actinoallomurus sp. NBC_01490 TaxID=2903557 RepID=UPI002E344858|nr:PP2C family protein-serine/threonine phosphatase [Actinoallomurus sp. NBC_01490]
MRLIWYAALRQAWRPGRALLVIPIALIVAIVAVDLLNGPGVHLGPLLIVAPAITAAFAGPGLVALIGALAVAGEVSTVLIEGAAGGTENETHVVALAVVSALIVFFSIVRERHRRQLTKAREVAEIAQHALMRPLPERVGPLRLASVYLTAEQEARIGGDLYAAARIRSGTRLIVGDVRGNGLAAIDTCALVAGAFRAAAHQRAALPELLDFLDNAACFEPTAPDTDVPDPDECFVTAVAVDIPDDRPVVHIINRGHPAPLLLSGGHVIELAAREPALPLGLGGLAHVGGNVESFPFERGDLLLLYTDGLIEARDAGGRFYPLAERVAGWPRTDPAGLITRLCEDLTAHVDGRLGDDAAMIAIQRSA